jgi:hypothetical protein
VVSWADATRGSNSVERSTAARQNRQSLSMASL